VVKVADTPLTTKALNAFFQTVHAELDKSGFRKRSEQDVLCDIAGLMLPVTDPENNHKELGYVLDAKPGIVGDKDYGLPETLRDLRARIKQAGTPAFDNEVKPEDAEKRYREILNIAFRAAEKEMGQVAATR